MRSTGRLGCMSELHRNAGCGPSDIGIRPDRERLAGCPHGRWARSQIEIERDTVHPLVRAYREADIRTGGCRPERPPREARFVGISDPFDRWRLDNEVQVAARV